ncbi:penicillin-binding protein 2 [candidate division KSB1 bacterium]|nr:MAG: penicillin-binding protein 2 [candidate division KSB1 bacterium]
MRSGKVGSESIRLWSFLVIGALLFGALGMRLFQLQVLQWQEFRNKSDSNRFRLIEIAPPRGVMRDHKGRLIVTNRPSYTCYGVPHELWRDKRGIALLNAALHMPPGFLENEVIKPYRRTFAPMRLKRDLSFSELSAFEEVRDQIPGAFLEVEQKRSYNGKLAAHMLGYVSEVSKEELEKFPDVLTGDLVGKRGLERIYDSALRGVKGRRFSVVNALGQEVAEAENLKRIDPVAGKELWLALDLDIQALAESLLVDQIGAVVAMDVRSGGVLAMASSPTYDPEIFAGRIDAAQWNALLEDPDKPMLNRAVQTMYPPGSTIKMAMLTEGLESGKITPTWSISCPGHYTVGNRTFKCWKKGGHGHVVPLRAIEASCDVFFYKLGMTIGVDGVHDAMARYHLGQATGVDQTSEAEGLRPSEAYYNRRYTPSGWTRGFIPSISIGQGEVLVTPVQMCAYVAALANGKEWRQPHLVEGIFDPEAQSLKRIRWAAPQPLNASPENIELVREGTRRVVWGDHGTARRQQDDLVHIAGKTGTAQNPHGDDHAWFVGYAPYEDPIVACCVLIEFGEHGSSAAAPVAKEIMKRFVLLEREGESQTAEAVARPH